MRFGSTAEINRFLDHMEDSNDEDAMPHMRAFATGKKQVKNKTPTKVKTKTLYFDQEEGRAASVEKAKQSQRRQRLQRRQL